MIGSSELCIIKEAHRRDEFKVLKVLRLHGVKSTNSNRDVHYDGCKYNSDKAEDLWDPVGKTLVYIYTFHLYCDVVRPPLGLQRNGLRRL